MPKVYGVKEKDQVVAHVVNLILTGKLRSGDRIDRNEIAEDLGLSRVPVQEAVVQLEHDGIVATQYHRGAFVERFDEATLAEHYEMHGLLDGMASARAATERSPTTLAKLEDLLHQLRVLTESRLFQDFAYEYRTVINDQYAGPRLRALIRSSLAFTPRGFWVAHSDSHAELLKFYEAETDAIRRGDADAARTANSERTATMARIMVAELRRRRVLGDLGSH